jgi:putative transposase
MDGSIAVSAADRKALLTLVRAAVGVRSRQAHVVLLRADGWSHRQIRLATFASFDFIGDAVRLYRRRGLAAFAEPTARRPLPPWATILRRWVRKLTPEDFGYFRRRWSCATLAHTLAFEHGIRVSAETVRRTLHRLGFAWRRPRPVVGPVDPDHTCKLQAIQELLRTLPPDEVAVFQDEVDIHLNPKIGAARMPRGRQAEVVTPGNNQKRHLAGSLVWRTGTLVVSPPGTRRNTALFLAHLDELRSRFRWAKRIHVICDNAAFHKSRAVVAYLDRWGHRIDLHFLPCYAPETNPIERVWWSLHETLTRNHKCANLDDLLNDVYLWIENQPCFYGPELHHYATAA